MAKMIVLSLFPRARGLSLRNQVLTEFGPPFVDADSVANDLGGASSRVGEFRSLHPRIFESRHAVDFSMLVITPLPKTQSLNTVSKKEEACVSHHGKLRQPRRITYQYRTTLKSEFA